MAPPLKIAGIFTAAIATADIAIANVETAIISRVFAANDFLAGTVFKITAFATRVGAPQSQLTLRIRIGTVPLLGNIAATLTQPNSNHQVGHQIEGMITIRSHGVAGTALGSLSLLTHSAPTSLSPIIAISPSPVTVNTTLPNQRIELTFQSGAPTSVFTFRNAAMWVVA